MSGLLSALYSSVSTFISNLFDSASWDTTREELTFEHNSGKTTNDSTELQSNEQPEVSSEPAKDSDEYGTADEGDEAQTEPMETSENQEEQSPAPPPAAENSN